jgi:hypothetical protein
MKKVLLMKLLRKKMMNKKDELVLKFKGLVGL